MVSIFVAYPAKIIGCVSFEVHLPGASKVGARFRIASSWCHIRILDRITVVATINGSG
jgi:hypothetical protein